MGFVTWHYVARIGVMVIFPLLIGGMFAPQGSVLGMAGRGAFWAMALLGMAGAILGILVFLTPFRFACPRCRKRSTQFGGSKTQGMWLHCEECALVFRETGVLHLNLTGESVADEADESSGTDSDTFKR